VEDIQRIGVILYGLLSCVRIWKFWCPKKPPWRSENAKNFFQILMW